jgi:4-amino-4-deoxy-L-arabinose transferase-like glycosyltransferase
MLYGKNGGGNFMSTVLFSEKQGFRQWWLWTLIIGLNAVMLGKILKEWDGNIMNEPNDSILFQVINFLVILGVTLLFLALRLETRITEEAIQVRFFPFHRKQRTYTWDMIAQAYTRSYHPITEYGGWGMRGIGNNRALNVSGKQGLQLVFTDGRKLLIGSQKTPEIEQVLNKLGKLKA